MDVQRILDRAQQGIAPSRNESLALLEMPERSLQANQLRAIADNLQRDKTGNAGYIWGQIGIEMYPCEVDCEFCSFGRSHTRFSGHTILSIDEIVRRAQAFTSGGDLYGLYLMTMHSFDEDYFAEVAEAVRDVIPKSTLLFANIGDVDRTCFERLREVGIDGVYHACRIGEGLYTKIDPETRMRTIQAAHDAGMRIRTCCEPIGAETSNEVIVDKLFELKELSGKLRIVDGVASAKRMSVPGTCFEGLEHEITNLRMAQINAIQVLVMSDVEDCLSIGFHEPNSISLTSGGNYMCAETGFNPRDNAADTSAGRGFDVPAVRLKLYEAGFEWVMQHDGTRHALTPERMQQAASFWENAD